MPDELEDFVGYWTEPSATGLLKFAMQKTWDTRRRMQTALRMIYGKDRGTGETGTQKKPLTRWDMTKKLEMKQERLARIGEADKDKQERIRLRVDIKRLKKQIEDF